MSAVKDLPGKVLAFRIDGGVNGETSDGLFIIFNSNTEAQEVSLPEGAWDVYVNGEKAGTEVLDTISGTAVVEPISALVLVKSKSAGTAAGVDKEDASEADSQTPGTDDETASESFTGFRTISIICAIIAVAAAVVAVVVVIVKKGIK